jgi:hypothetical protein
MMPESESDRANLGMTHGQREWLPKSAVPQQPTNARGDR